MAVNFRTIRQHFTTFQIICVLMERSPIVPVLIVGNFLVVTYPTSVNIINNYVNNCSGIGVEIGLEQINKHGCLVQGNNIINRRKPRNLFKSG